MTPKPEPQRPQAPALVPDPLGGMDPGDMPVAVRRLFIAARQLAARSISTNTARVYLQSWARFTQWCSDRHLASLPAAPATVALYLTERCAALDTSGGLLTDAEGQPVPGALRPQSARVALSAINRVHRIQGHAPPGKDPHVSMVFEGIKRTYGTASTKAKEALVLDLVELVIAAVDRGDPGEVCLLLGLEAGMSLRELAGLEARDVSLGDGGAVLLRALGGASERQVVIRSEIVEPAEWFGALLDLQPARSLLGLGTSGLHARARRLARDAGCPPGADLSDPEISARVIRARLAPTTSQARDRALVLIGFYSALRRSNLVALRWSDLRPHPEGVKLVLRRSKTDQVGAGTFVVIPASPDPGRVPCPLGALEAWAAEVALVVGGNPLEVAPEAPVFNPVDRHGRIRCVDGMPVRLSADAVCRRIQTLAARAGLDPAKLGAHSLRAGFVTEAFDSGATVPDVKEVTLHHDTRTLFRYARHAGGATTRAARAVMGLPARPPRGPGRGTAGPPQGI